MTGNLSVEAAGERVSELLQQRVGLRPDTSVRGRLIRSIRDDAASRGQNLDSYLDTLLLDDQALQSLLNRVTVQETAFFRHPEHYDVLARDLLPRLQAPVIIWSAGCANGQEAFSLAMLLEEHNIDGSVVATDLSTTAVQRTVQARYSAREITGLSPERIARHLTASAGEWQINTAIRDRVITLHHNLLDPLPRQVSACQIIFCRNVLIYFSPEHAAMLLNRIADALPSASLFLGAAESVWQLSDRFETVPAFDTFSYRCRLPPAAPHQRPAIEPANRTAGTPGTPDRTRGLNHQRASKAPAGSTAAAGGLARTTHTRRPRTEVSTAQPEIASPQELMRTGQQASAAGNHQSAVTAFRKCAYLSPHDPVAHLHLGLALEIAGDRASARRAYAAARHALLEADTTQVEQAVDGYTAADLHRLLDTKLQDLTR